MTRTLRENMKDAVQQSMDAVMDDFSLQVRLAFLGDACMSERGTCMCAPYTYTAEYIVGCSSCEWPWDRWTW
jgi:hypothetical protein